MRPNNSQNFVCQVLCFLMFSVMKISFFVCQGKLCVNFFCCYRFITVLIVIVLGNVALSEPCAGSVFVFSIRLCSSSLECSFLPFRHCECFQDLKNQKFHFTLFRIFCRMLRAKGSLRFFLKSTVLKNLCDFWQWVICLKKLVYRYVVFFFILVVFEEKCAFYALKLFFGYFCTVQHL